MVAEAIAQTTQSRYETVKAELEEARRDLSRRPDPDVTGCVQHSMAALECAARICSGDENATLGEIIKRQSARLGIPKPLDKALEKFWGYASDKGRHLREGGTPNRDEAELLLSVAAAVTTYLLQKNTPAGS